MLTRTRATAVLAAGVAVVSAMLSSLAVSGPAEAAPAPRAEEVAERLSLPEPAVIGHRGASGYRPEHTLAAYKLAIQMGADVIEPDLVSTKDHVLVARHENEIGGTTDVASRPEFANRKKTKVIDGQTITGWFTEDFTLAELKTLRAKERIPSLRPHNTLYDGRYQVPTLQEVIDLAREETRRTGRRIWIYPETKHPTYFRSIGLPLEEALAATLKRNGWAGRNAPVLIQSFEPGALQRLDRLVGVRLVQLIDEKGAPADFVAKGDPRTYDDLVKPEGLKWIATFADGIGPAKKRIVPWDPRTQQALPPTTLVRDAHELGLLVHSWTFRNENQFLPADLRRGTDPGGYGDAYAEYETFYRLGVDGVFSDNPDTAVDARADFWEQQERQAS
nr:glycerophosphodiester phosphodiesterase [Carbonactinospora thermoautotrophica]